MNITVIGCGRWGTFIAWYLDKIGHSATLYGRPGSANMARLERTRKNEYLALPEGVRLDTSLNSIAGSDVIVISVNAQGLRGLAEEMREQRIRNKIFVLCMKGLEIGSGKRLSEILSENTDASNLVAVWLGPGHVQEFYRGIPNCMVIDSEDARAKELLVGAFSSELIRFYYGQDLIGNEIGAAAKNVIGIAAGILDGLGLSTLKGALMSRGTREIARLIRAMGGNELSAYGLCHLGDYEATVFSEFSHNRRYGECLVRGEEYGELAEGRDTAKAMMALGEKYGVDLPICGAVYRIIYSGTDAGEEVFNLFTRSLKKEF